MPVFRASRFSFLGRVIHSIPPHKNYTEGARQYKGRWAQPPSLPTSCDSSLSSLTQISSYPDKLALFALRYQHLRYQHHAILVEVDNLCTFRDDCYSRRHSCRQPHPRRKYALNF